MEFRFPHKLLSGSLYKWIVKTHNYLNPCIWQIGAKSLNLKMWNFSFWRVFERDQTHQRAISILQSNHLIVLMIQQVFSEWEFYFVFFLANSGKKFYQMRFMPIKNIYIYITTTSIKLIKVKYAITRSCRSKVNIEPEQKQLSQPYECEACQNRT